MTTLMQGNRLYVQSYEFGVDAREGGPLVITIELVMPVVLSQAGPDVAEATLGKLAKWLHDPEGIALVRATDRPRCFYCAQLNEIGVLKCIGCAGTL